MNCDPIEDLNFLGAGTVLFFVFLRHSIYLLLILFLGIGIFNCYKNSWSGFRCYGTEEDYRL